MDPAVESIIKKLENHELPDNEGEGEYRDSWGINFFWDENTNNDIFSRCRVLYKTLLEARKNLLDNGRKVTDTEMMPRFTLDYKHGDWLLDFEFYTEDDQLDDRFSLMVRLTLDKVKEILGRLHDNKISAIDINGTEVF